MINLIYALGLLCAAGAFAIFLILGLAAIFSILDRNNEDD